MNRVGVAPALLRWARERSGRRVQKSQIRFPHVDVENPHYGSNI